MKNKIKKIGLTLSITLWVVFFTNSTFGQNSKTCEKIVFQIYDGINQKKSDHLLQHLSKDFSMAGQNGEIAIRIFPVYITNLSNKVSNIKKLTETKTDVLILTYEAKFSDNELIKSTFIFNKDNKLIKMDLLPTMLKKIISTQ